MDVSEGHIDTLTKAAIEAGPEGLDEPLDVWWSGTRFVLVDGHHRLEAYRRAEEHHASAKRGKRGGPYRVLVNVLPDMPPEEAQARAVSRNARDKLNMAPDDKSNAAWRIVCLDHPKPPLEPSASSSITSDR